MAEHRLPAWLGRQASRAWHCLAGDGWMQALCRAVVVVALLGIGGLLFVAAGLMPIAASEGHWAVTRAFLQFTMRSSVRTQTLGMEAPPLDDPGLVLKGAGHYASSCLPCHGGPGEPRALVVRRMTPEPPYLPGGFGTLRDTELFWIVRHGIKYTAMPAWPAPQREDEVWAMVAFLRALPRLEASEFRRLAYGDTSERNAAGPGSRQAPPGQPMPSALADCERCHGADGMGRGNGAIPRLAGLDEAYLRASLAAFARGDRHSGIMQTVASGLDVAEMRAFARHFSSLEADAPAPRCDSPAAFARGARLATHGDPARKIPACTACHGPGPDARDPHALNPSVLNPLYPDLSGQHADYLALQLELFRNHRRGGTAYAGLMRAAADRLEDGDIRDLATYYAALPEGCPNAGQTVP